MLKDTHVVCAKRLGTANYVKIPREAVLEKSLSFDDLRILYTLNLIHSWQTPDCTQLVDISYQSLAARLALEHDSRYLLRRLRKIQSLGCIEYMKMHDQLRCSIARSVLPVNEFYAKAYFLPLNGKLRGKTLLAFNLIISGWAAGNQHGTKPSEQGWLKFPNRYFAFWGLDRTDTFRAMKFLQHHKIITCKGYKDDKVRLIRIVPSSIYYPPFEAH